MKPAKTPNMIRFWGPILICSLLLNLSLPSISLADPATPDTIIVLSNSFDVGSQATIDVWTYSDEWLTGLEITLTWAWDSLAADSFHFNPLRLASSAVRGSTPYLNNITIYALPADEWLISPGYAWLGTIYFNYPDSAAPQTVAIDTTTLYLSDSLLIRTNIFTDTIWPEPFVPQFRSGDLTMTVCCTGQSGNTDCDSEDRTNLADITRLIDRVYISKLPLCCEASGNVNGDIDRRINLADITLLIDHVYISKGDTAPCF